MEHLPTRVRFPKMSIIDVRKMQLFYLLKNGVLKIFTFSLDQLVPAMKLNTSVHNPPAVCKPMRWLPKTAEMHILKIRNALFTASSP